MAEIKPSKKQGAGRALKLEAVFSSEMSVDFY
jgi:hypothetical protein